MADMEGEGGTGHVAEAKDTKEGSNMEEIAGLKIHTMDISSVKLAEGIDDMDFEGFCRMVGLMDAAQFYAFLERFETDYLDEWPATDRHNR